MIEVYFKNCQGKPVTVSSQAVLIFLPNMLTMVPDYVFFLKRFKFSFPDYNKDVIKMLGSFLMYGSVAGEKKNLRETRQKIGALRRNV